MINYLNGQIIYGNLKDAIVLLPCPFCGEDPALLKEPIIGYDNKNVYSIRCSACGAMPDECSQSDLHDDTIKVKRQIIENWNRRAVR